MRELKELFDMVTSETEPDLDAWREQEERQRRRATNRRLGAFAVAAAVAIGAVVAALALQGADTSEPLTSSTTPSAVSAGASLVAIDVVTGQAGRVLPDVEADRPALSPDGTSIAFVQNVKGHPAIFVANLDGTRAQQVTGLPGQPGCACGSFDPAWSPDGSQLAYTGTSEAGNRGIYVLDPATGDVVAITHWHGDSYEVAPAWSPNGDTIAFAAGRWDADPAGSGAIYTVRVGAGHPRLLVRHQGATDPTWSPDGRIVYSANDGSGGTMLEQVDVPSGDVTQLRLGATPTYSPDGSAVAFSDGTQLGVLTVATGEVRILGTGGDPAWSPDGRTIYAWRA
jgi:Tol biopolymer transport system component